MSETSSRVRLMANLQAAVAEAVSGTSNVAGAALPLTVRRGRS